MQKIGDMSFSRNVADSKFLDYRSCLKCGGEIKVVKLTYTQDFGIFKKGDVQNYNQDCNCQLIQEVRENDRKARQLAINKYSIINDELKEATIETFDIQQGDLEKYGKRALSFIEMVTNYKKGDSFYLYGEVGRGKSHLASAVHHLLLERGISSLFINFPTMFSLFKQSYDKATPFTESDLYRAIYEANMLILDDFGVGYINEWKTEIIYNVLNSRQGKSTIFTTNFHPNDLNKKFESREIDRVLNRMSSEHIICLELPDSYRSRNRMIKLKTDRSNHVYGG
ncbi:ATP-binding protein [Bacillus pseudomycoides]|uniref:ATP-binding protein n=1 Tax=Bacillus pseudomycoides TaxID=64104 RepID=UPI002FFEEEB7